MPDRLPDYLIQCLEYHCGAYFFTIGGYRIHYGHRHDHLKHIRTCKHNHRGLYSIILRTKTPRAAYKQMVILCRKGNPQLKYTTYKIGTWVVSHS